MRSRSAAEVLVEAAGVGATTGGVFSTGAAVAPRTGAGRMFEAPAGGARAGACVVICFFGAAIVLAGLTAAAACIAKIMAGGGRGGGGEGRRDEHDLCAMSRQRRDCGPEGLRGREKVWRWPTRCD